jgi:putative sugar O-methyltransferase
MRIAVPSRLTDAEIVRTARNNLESAIYYRSQAASISLGDRWATYARWARENISSLPHPVDIIRFAQTKFSFEIRESGEALLYAVAAYEWKILAEFPQAAAYLAALFEPGSSDPNSVVLYKGRNMATYLCHLVRFHLVMTTYIRSPLDTICEIGGGYGALARVWFISPVRKPKQYILVDLAESLFFAEAFLRYELPQLRIVHLTAEPGGDADIVLCPLELLDRVRTPVDLVINTQSMSEMPEQCGWT